jgi:prevent-host-death family protein
MAEKITIHAAKTNLSKLIAKAERGEEIIIYRGDKPAAKLVAANDTVDLQPRKPGFLKGVIHLDDSFFDPLPADMLLPSPPSKPKPKRK